MVFAFLLLCFSCWAIGYVAFFDSSLSSFSNNTLKWDKLKLFVDQDFFTVLPMVFFSQNYLQVAPEIYEELRTKNKQRKVHLVFLVSTLVSCCLYALAGVLVFMTFEVFSDRFNVFGKYTTAVQTNPIVMGVLLVLSRSQLFPITKIH